MIVYPVIPPEVIERFRKYLVELESGCIEWIGGVEGCGYGWFNHHIEGVSARAHRFAFALHHGCIDNELNVLHTCDNPPCCNPAHLFQGTQKNNVDDMVAKGRHGVYDRRGELNPMAKLTNTDVVEIRRLRAELGLTYREIAHLFPVSPDMISFICRRICWK